MEREGTFHALSCDNSADRESRATTGISSADDGAIEDLDPFLVAFNYSHMHIDSITDMEIGEPIRLQVIFLEIIDLVRHLILPESLPARLHLDFCPENPHRLRDFQSSL